VRAVVQRVSNASVTIDGNIHEEIGHGLVLLIGIESADNKDDILWLASKIAGLRIFNDDQGVMNLNVRDIKGEILLVSQFTLHARVKKGNRPSYISAAKTDIAIPLYEEFKARLSTMVEGQLKAGIFAADMKVAMVNDGPVTIIIDTKNKE